MLLQHVGVYGIQTDNDAEFQSHFDWHLEALDIRHVYVRREYHTPTARSRVRIPSTTRSSTSSSIATGLRTTFTGRTTTIATDRTGLGERDPVTNGSWQRLEPERHRCPEK